VAAQQGGEGPEVGQGLGAAAGPAGARAACQASAARLGPGAGEGQW
jgi:hypothetical protein